MQYKMGLVFGLRAERLLLDLLDAVKSEEPEGPPGPDPESEADLPPEDVNRG